MIDYIFNEGNKTTRRRDNDRIIWYPNHNTENDLEEATAKTRGRLGGDRITRTGGTGPILLADIMN